MKRTELIPYISMPIMRDVSGQLVTPQNMPTMPQAAHKPTGRPKRGAMALPKVAPTKKVGMISPPLKPPLRVMAVKSILSKNTYHCCGLLKLSLIISVPAPR